MNLPVFIIFRVEYVVVYVVEYNKHSYEAGDTCIERYHVRTKQEILYTHL